MKLSNIKKTVVVPFDFSKLSCLALEQAIDLVDDISLIRVVHVAEYPSAYEYGVSWETINRDQVVKRVQEAFNEKMAQINAMPEFEITVLFGGNPGEEICRFAKDLGAELILIPSHGRTGFERFLLGSVAERVIRFAPCPVYVLRQDEEISLEPDSDQLELQKAK